MLYHAFPLARWERGLLPMGLVLSPQGNRSNVVIAGLAAGHCAPHLVMS